MFHVSVLLPFTANEEQQVSRKRHLGNDIVLILFFESDCSLKFDPRIIRSVFNHVFFVIQKDQELSTKDRTFYRVEITAKEGVLKFKPSVPENFIIEKDENGKKVFVYKTYKC